MTTGGSDVFIVCRRRRNTRSVPRATVVRAVLTVAMSALLTGVLFSYFYIEVFNAPEPYRLPVAVVGADASRLQDAVGDGYRLVQMTRREEGLERLSRHEVYGVVSLDGGGSERGAVLHQR